MTMFWPDDEVCGYLCVHDEQVRRVQAALPEDETLLCAAELFKLFGDGTRLKILFALKEGELCVCDLARLLDMTISAVSHQLRLLRQARLVRTRRDGRTIFYALDDDHIDALLAIGLLHINEEA